RPAAARAAARFALTMDFPTPPFPPPTARMRGAPSPLSSAAPPNAPGPEAPGSPGPPSSEIRAALTMHPPTHPRLGSGRCGLRDSGYTAKGERFWRGRRARTVRDARKCLESLDFDNGVGPEEGRDGPRVHRIICGDGAEEEGTPRAAEPGSVPGVGSPRGDPGCGTSREARREAHRLRSRP